MRYVTILNGIVDNVIIADEMPPRGVQSDTANMGDLYDGENFTPVPIPVPPEPVPPVYEWYIDIGPFFDRFGAQKLPVLMSTDPTLQAILRDVQVRKWVDLKRADVADALMYIETKVPAVTPALRSLILNTPVADSENLAVRTLFFS
jgi:hypothetical protein